MPPSASSMTSRAGVICGILIFASCAFSLPVEEHLHGAAQDPVISIMEVETKDHAVKEQATRDLRDATVDEAGKTGETVTVVGNNENVDIESSTGTKTALSLNEFTNTATGRVTVQSTRHPAQGDNGKYFFFDRHQWSTTFGDLGLVFVVQSRGGAEIWRGVVITWSNGNGVHGRRYSGDANSQWRVGDRLVPPGNPSGLQNAGQNCWGSCGNQQGPCAFCGTGLCCRFGWHDHSNGCDGTIGVQGQPHHMCAAQGMHSSAVLVVQRDCCTRNDRGRSRRGRYFWFNMRQWQGIFGTRGVKSVVQSRDGLTIWRGNVRSWDNNRDGDGAHGRREPFNSAQNGQFRTGDVLSVPGGSLENPWHPSRPVAIQGRWKYWFTKSDAAARQYTATVGVTRASGSERTQQWSSEVAVEVTSGFSFLGNDAEVTVSASYSQGASSSISRSTEQSVTSTDMVTFTSPGAVWQFDYTVTDSLGRADIQTIDTATTAHRGQTPCCLPGDSLDPNRPYGPCRPGAPCTCPASVCGG